MLDFIAQAVLLLPTDDAKEKIETFGDFSTVAAEKVATAIKYVQQHWGLMLWNVLLIFLIFVTAKIILVITSKITSSAIKSREKSLDLEATKRTRTVLSLFRSFMRYFVYIAAVLILLVHFEVTNAGELLTGAGVSAIVIGFGAQSIVKDVFSGLFIIFENQFSVGDHIKIDEAEGFVEATALRVTYLRTFKGERIIIPNGMISDVINYTSGGFVAAVETPVAYHANVKMVMQIIDNAVQIYALTHKELTENDPIVLGISEFKESYLLIKTICKAKNAFAQWDIERGMRLAIKEAFDVAKIDFPFPSYNIYTDKHNQKQDYNTTKQSEYIQNKYTKKPIWQQEEKGE